MLPIYTITNSRAKGVAFINKNQAISRGYYLEPIKTPIPLLNFNREGEEFITITYFLVTNLRIYNYLEKEAFLFTINLFYYLIILGIPQLKLHNPKLKFKKGTIIFNSKYY